MSNVTAAHAYARPAVKSVWREAIQTQLRVFHAIILHDIKSRFFGNGLGYVVTILWPGVHLAVIIGIFYFRGQQVPYGSSRLLYASVGVLPYIIWSYISRFTLLCILTNRSFLNYPVVKPLDLMIARQALELVTSTIVTIGLVLFLIACGVDPTPHRLDQAIFAILSSVLLGIGFGILGAVITMIVPLFHVVYIFIMILCWATCGVAFDPEAMPSQVAAIMSWNPLLHCVEWMRFAYYDDFPAHLLDRTYLLAMGAGALAIGLVMERSLRVFTMK